MILYIRSTLQCVSVDVYSVFLFQGRNMIHEAGKKKLKVAKITLECVCLLAYGI